MPEILLGGYPAKQCARITHNRYSPSAPPPIPVSADLQMLFDEGRVFEAAVVDELVRQYAGSHDLRVLDDDHGWDNCKRRTVEAMEAAVSVIAGGRLPDVNGRVGAPDLLVRHGAGYLPVDIKNHRTLRPASNPDNPKSRAQVVVSTLAAPDARCSAAGFSNKGGHWRDDTMQLAHYTRMLQELGFHPTDDPDLLIGGIIGTSNFTALTADELGITWYDLTARDETTYSNSEPTHRKRRSALERYDHEYRFRIKVAEAARDGLELVRPYRTNDCGTCEWFDYCVDVAGADDASFSLAAGHLNVREWLFLYQDGARLTVNQLAATDADACIDGFRTHSVGTQKPRKRLDDAIRRAGMTLAGIEFEPRGSWPGVPSADVEVDFDIEWDTDGRIYQWGLRVRDGQDDATARYEPVVSFEPLDEASEESLAQEFAERLTALKVQARQANKSLLVFHWHHVEVSMTRKFAAVEAALDGVTVDLLSWFNAGFFARQSASIKNIAPLFGFGWGVEDPGGRISQSKIIVARGSGPEAPAARDWCLRYNESDVAAQAAIRDGLRRNRSNVLS